MAADAANYKTITVPFIDKGLVQRVSPSLLQPGEYFYLQNMISYQEGALQSRLGDRLLTNSISAAISSGSGIVHSLGKLRLSNDDTSNLRYIGYDNKIFRCNIHTDTRYFNAVTVAVDASNATYLTSNSKWDAVNFSFGSQGDAYVYFATSTFMVKDSGSYDKLQRWGMGRPQRAAVAYPGPVSLAIHYVIPPTWVGSPTTARIRVSLNVTSVNALYQETNGNGYYRLSWSAGFDSGNGMVEYPREGMLLNSSTTNKGVIVTKVNVTSKWFECYSGYLFGFSGGFVPPTGLWYEYMDIDLTTSSGISSFTYPITLISNPDLSYIGTEQDNYDSGDYVGFTFKSPNPQQIDEIRFRVKVGPLTATSSAYYDDYYEKVLSPNQANALVDSATTVGTTVDAFGQASDRSLLINSGVVGDRAFDQSLPPDNQVFAEVDPTIRGMQPFEVQPVSPVPSFSSFFDFLARKTEFLKVGRAGTPGYNWKNVNSFEFVVRSKTTATVTYHIGHIFSYGGFPLEASVPGSFPYDWRFVFRNPVSGHVSNPSVEMVQQFTLPASRRAVAVVCYGVDGALNGSPQQVYYSTPTGTVNPGTIWVYRRGGSYSDGLWRKSGEINNTGPNQIALIDGAADIDILGADIIEEDNDPPVTARLPVAFSATISAGSASGENAVYTLTVAPSTYAEGFSNLKTGSIVHYGKGQQEEETVLVAFNTAASTIQVFLQRDQATFSNGLVGQPVSINAIEGQPCDLACVAFYSIFLAGDNLNPHILYKSKTSQPDSFPVVNQGTGAVNQLPVGSPSNRINGITEYDGQVLCLNQNGLYIVNVWNGVMQAAVETPAQRGMVAKRCFCKGDGSIYYLAYDGIYRWSGGASEKISEQIDYIFRDRFINGIYPLDKTAYDQVAMEYSKNELHFAYLDYDPVTNAKSYRRLRYVTAYKRWYWEAYQESTGLGTIIRTSAMFTEVDTGKFLVSRVDSNGSSTINLADAEGNQGTTDGWQGSVGFSGTAIFYNVVTPPFDAGMPTKQKLFQDVIMEVENPASHILIEVLYDYATPIYGGGVIFESFTISADFGDCTISGTSVTRLSGVFYDPSMIAQTAYIGTNRVVISNVTSPGTLTINATLAPQTATMFVYRRKRVPIPIGNSGGLANGREAAAIAFRMTPLTSGTGNSNVIPTKFYSITYNYCELTQIQRARSSDWTDLGYPYDKKLNVFTIEYDLTGTFGTISPTPYFVYLDIVGGVSGETQITQITSFQLGLFGTGRSKQSFGIKRLSDNSMIVAKMVRIRTSFLAENTYIKIFDWNIDFEKYPPDIVYFTQPEDNGSPFTKYFNEVIMEVDTGSQPAVAEIYFDSSIIPFQSITFASSAENRMQIFTLQQGAIGKLARMRFTPGAAVGSKFQLFNHKYITSPADKGPVAHSMDWDDQGWPWDKRFYHVSWEVETPSTLVMLLEGIFGLGQPSTPQAQATIQSFTISPASYRQLITYQFPDDAVYKMVRVRPKIGDPTSVDAKIYPPRYKFEQYPPDVVSFTERSNFGSPFTKYFQQLLLEVDTANVGSTVIVEVDGTDACTFSNVFGSQHRRNINLTMPGNISGKEARLKNTPGVGGKFQLFHHDFVAIPADKGPVLHTFDWQDLGHPFDKRFYHVYFEYEVQTDMTMLVQVVNGVGGTMSPFTVETITLSASPNSRKQQQYTFPDGTVSKLVRLAPASGVPPPDAKIYQPQFQFEKYPPDIVPFTETNEYGSPYEKYFQQLVMEVDTGAVAASVIVEIDGQPRQTLTATTNSLNRNLTLTLNPMILGRRARILNTPGVNGKFQLFNSAFVTVPADKGPVLHSFDWDDLEHPFDKRLKTMTLEFDNNNVETVINMDTITGINGNTRTVATAAFTLAASAGRCFKTFPINDGTIVKMVKLYPVSTTVQLKEWRYKFDYEKLPADIILFTPWEDLGYPCEKLIRSVTIEADTGGIPAQVDLQADGGTVYSFPVYGTSEKRNSIITVPSDIIGREFRLKPTPGENGKFQLFSYRFERLIEPCYLTHWDSYEQSFGSNGYKFMKQMWVEYTCKGGIRVSIYTDNGVLFYSVSLPFHGHRDVERFYLPKAGSGGRYNKTKIFRVVVDAIDSQPFKLYRDASRMETMNIGADQREGYLQSYLYQQMPIPT